MFETERLLLADAPFIPLYTYVTKRMVNPRLKGWQSNVMDHHYSKHMFFLKAASDKPPTVAGAIDVSETEGQNIRMPESIQELDAPGEGDDVILKEGDAESTLPGIDAENAAPGQEQGMYLPLEENETDVTDENMLPDAMTADGTTPEDSLE